MESIQKIIRALLSENGCPWDKKQTPATLSVHLLEEVYELVSAIASDDEDNIMEEIGDTLFQLIFIAFLYQKKGTFSIDALIERNVEKMVRRHPHVFGDVTAETIDEVNANWDAIKKKEKKDLPETPSVLDTIPKGMPALGRAFKISERVCKLGFDWDDMAGVIRKVYEEWQELGAALETKSHETIAMEFGDLLFTLVNVARFAGIHPETALTSAIEKFEARYRHMEQAIASKGLTLKALTREEIDRMWDLAKSETA